MICVNMRVQEFSEKGAFFRVRLRSEIRVSFLAYLSNKGTFFRALLIYGVILVFFTECSPYNGHSKLFIIAIQ